MSNTKAYIDVFMLLVTVLCFFCAGLDLEAGNIGWFLFDLVAGGIVGTSVVSALLSVGHENRLQ